MSLASSSLTAGMGHRKLCIFICFTFPWLIPISLTLMSNAGRGSNRCSCSEWHHSSRQWLIQIDQRIDIEELLGSFTSREFRRPNDANKIDYESFKPNILHAMTGNGPSITYTQPVLAIV